MKGYYTDSCYMGLMPNGTYQRFPTIDEYHEVYTLEAYAFEAYAHTIAS